MKKLYLLLLFFAISLTIAKAQDLALDHPVINYSGPASDPLQGNLTIVNNSQNTLDVICESSRNLVAGHQTFFCWYVCYDPSILTSPDSIRLAPGQATVAFYDHVVAGGISGHDEITYRFYDKHGNSDTLTVVMTYDFAPVGVFEISSKNNSFNFTGANPASSNTSISYIIQGKQDAKLIVTNMLGSKVSEIPLNYNQNSLTLSVRDYKPGIYIYTLYVDGKPMSSKKLIVAQH